MKRLIACTLSLLIACTWLSCNSNPEPPPGPVVKGPPQVEIGTAWDPVAMTAFERAGIAPPRTAVAGQPATATIDRQRIAEAFAPARKLADVQAEGGEMAADEEVSEEMEVTRDGGLGGPVPRPEATPQGGGPGRNYAGPSGGATVPPPPSEAAADPTAAAPGAPAPRPSPSAQPGAPSPARIRDLARDGSEAEKKDKAGGDEAVPPRKLTTIAGAPRLGKLLYDGPDGKLASMKPRALRLVVMVDGLRARTVVDCVFENPVDRQLQGTFFYALPAGASPAGFGMFRGTAPAAKLGGGGQLLPAVVNAAADPTSLAAAAGPAGGSVDWKDLQEARVVGQKRARQVYEEIVRQNIDPALLEWSGGNTFRARVFPIEPRSVKRVLLAYEQTLPRHGSDLVYTYPLPDEASLGGVTVELFVHGAAPRVLRLGEGVLEVDLQAETDGWQRSALDLPAKGENLMVTVPSQGEAGIEVIRAPADPLPGSAFLARVRPDVPDVTDPEPTGRALFLLDTSLSSEGPWHGMSTKLMQTILEEDPTISEYAVLLFDLRPRWLHAAGWRSNDATSRAATARELDRIWLEGATSLDAVLGELEAQASWIGGGARMFLLSDGAITWGQDRVPALLADHGAAMQWRWTSYRYGELAANIDLYEAIARASGGQAVHVLSEDQLDAAAAAHRKLPVRLRGVTVTGPAVEDLVVAGDPVLIYPGQELLVAGRLTGAGTPQLTVSFEAGSVVTRQVASLDGGGGGLAARAWAQLHVAELLALDDLRLDRMVVALSQAYGLGNRAASFLVLDDAAEYERYDIRNENVDLRNLATLRAQEEDQRRAKLLGLDLEGVPPSGQAVLEELARGPVDLPRPQPIPSLDLPLAGGDERLSGERSYRDARGEDPLDVQAYVAVAQARAMAGDTTGAVRALSCLVEKRPGDAEAARLVGYACLALGQWREAADLFARVRINRPWEPQCYLEEALALECQARFAEAARNYEIVLARDFPRHQGQARQVARHHYLRLLRALQEHAPHQSYEARFLELAPANEETEWQDLVATCPLQITMHWNSDSVDIDLWVFEPEGTKVFYSNMTSDDGGRLFWDITDGYGPELYQRQKAATGSFHIAANYYGNNSARWHVPTAVLLVRDQDPFGAEGHYTRRFRMAMLGDKEAVLSLSREEP